MLFHICAKNKHAHQISHICYMCYIFDQHILGMYAHVCTTCEVTGINQMNHRTVHMMTGKPVPTVKMNTMSVHGIIGCVGLTSGFPQMVTNWSSNKVHGSLSDQLPHATIVASTTSLLGEIQEGLWLLILLSESTRDGLWHFLPVTPTHLQWNQSSDLSDLNWIEEKGLWVRPSNWANVRATSTCNQWISADSHISSY